MWRSIQARRTAFVLLIGAALGFLLEQLFENWFGVQVVQPIQKFLGWLVGRPVGYAGLILAGLLVLLLLLAFLDTSPTVEWLRSRSARRKPKRSAEDRHEVETLRAAWRLGPRESCDHALRALDGAWRLLATPSDPFPGLLLVPRDRLHVARQQLERLLEESSTESIDIVVSVFKEAVAAYSICVTWYNRCRRVHPPFLGDGDPAFGADFHRRWVVDHRRFFQELDRLCGRSVYQRHGVGRFAEQLSSVGNIGEDRLPPELVAMDEIQK